MPRKRYIVERDHFQLFFTLLLQKEKKKLGNFLKVDTLVVVLFETVEIGVKHSLSCSHSLRVIVPEEFVHKVDSIVSGK